MQKILITGPESTGKSTLAQRLAAYYGMPWVPEYARQYLEGLHRPYVKSDLHRILSGQLASEEQAAQTAPRLLFCDTGPEVIAIWSAVRFGSVDPPVRMALQPPQYDYGTILLCYPDLPWIADPLREAPNPEVRLALFGRYEALLSQLKRPYHIIRGMEEQRMWSAIQRINALLY